MGKENKRVWEGRSFWAIKGSISGVRAIDLSVSGYMVPYIYLSTIWYTVGQTNAQSQIRSNIIGGEWWGVMDSTEGSQIIPDAHDPGWSIAGIN
jgi:hypothetical protein